MSANFNAELSEWQLCEIRDALDEADAGDFSSDDEIRQLAEKWCPDNAIRNQQFMNDVPRCS